MSVKGHVVDLEVSRKKSDRIDRVALVNQDYVLAVDEPAGPLSTETIKNNHNSVSSRSSRATRPICDQARIPTAICDTTVNKAIGYDLQCTKTPTMTRNQPLQITTAYGWHDPIRLRQLSLFREGIDCVARAMRILR